MNQVMSKPTSEVAVEKIKINYKGSGVAARKLTVSTVIPMDIDKAWGNVQTPELLQFVAKGMIHFKSVSEKFPKKWEVGKTYGAKMRIFGFIPFGGIHYLNILAIDSKNHTIATKEWDSGAKVWDHEVKMKAIGTDAIHYKDTIVIYGGILTALITAFARLFYKHRQKRWLIVAKDQLAFGR